MTREESEKIAMDALDVDESYGITSMETCLVQAGWCKAMEAVYKQAQHCRAEYGTHSLEYSHFMDWLDTQLKEPSA